MGGGGPLEDAMLAEIGDVRRTQECEVEGTSKGPACAEAGTVWSGKKQCARPGLSSDLS